MNNCNHCLDRGDCHSDPMVCGSFRLDRMAAMEDEIPRIAKELKGVQSIEVQASNPVVLVVRLEYPVPENAKVVIDAIKDRMWPLVERGIVNGTDAFDFRLVGGTK